MQGTMPCACRRGRPRTAWMDNIKTWTHRGRVNQNSRGQWFMVWIEDDAEEQNRTEV